MFVGKKTKNKCLSDEKKKKKKKSAGFCMPKSPEKLWQILLVTVTSSVSY